jgi:phospholipid/cholesterol/gamma-HCH transport system substrate-binding protein
MSNGSLNDNPKKLPEIVMNDKKTKFFVGFFVAGGLAIIVVTVIWLGMSNFLKKGDHYSIFFNESVQGLTVEAPVKYRGVPIGRVQQIKVAADSHLIKVVIELDHEFTMREKVIAQLKVVGITGNMFIELDQLSAQVPVPAEAVLNFPTEYPVIPSRSSDIKQLFDSVDDIVQKLRAIDITRFVSDVQETIHHIDTAITGADIPRLSAKVQTSLEQFDSALASSNLPEVVRNLSSLLAHIDQSVQKLDIEGLSSEAKKSLLVLRQESQQLLETATPLLTNATRTADAAESTLKNVDRQLLIIGQQTQRTNAKLNDLLDHISDQPSQLIFGDAPPRRLQ